MTDYLNKRVKVIGQEMYGKVIHEYSSEVVVAVEVSNQTSGNEVYFKKSEVQIVEENKMTHDVLTPKDFLNADQIKELEQKDWEVIPKCRFLDLYREDFTSDSVWQEVCDVFNKRYANHITILNIGVIINDG